MEWQLIINNIDRLRILTKGMLGSVVNGVRKTPCSTDFGQKLGCSGIVVKSTVLMMEPIGFPHRFSWTGYQSTKIWPKNTYRTPRVGKFMSLAIFGPFYAMAKIFYATCGITRPKMPFIIFSSVNVWQASCFWDSWCNIIMPLCCR